MKLFSDADKAQEIGSTLDFGAVTAGEKQTFEYFIENDSKAELKHIKFFTSHVELRVLKAPETLKPFEVASLVIEWAPSITLKEGLKSQLRIEATEFWS